MNHATLQLYPFSQLRPVVDSEGPSLPRSIWAAAVVAWLMFCITTRAEEFGKFENRAGVEHSICELLGIAGLFAVAVTGLLRTLIRFEPCVWNPRLGVIARCRLRRPIVWSWDRLFLPDLLNAALLCLAVTFGLTVSPTTFSAMAFTQVLVSILCRPTPELWQLTSDARLSPPSFPRYESPTAAQTPTL